jgi:hypothetical protein
VIEMAAQRARRGLVGARRAAQPQVDAARIQRASVPNCSATTSGEWLGSMMPPEPTRIVDVPRDVADQHGRGGAGDAGHVVVLGQPEAAIAQAFRMLRQASVLCMASAASLPSAMGERSSRE